MIKLFAIPSEKIRDAKKILENPDVVTNKWARNGYNLRDAKILGFERDCSYLYVEGPEEFFKENEKQITEIEGVKTIDGNEFDEVKAKIDEEEAGKIAGIGSFFG